MLGNSHCIHTAHPPTPATLTLPSTPLHSALGGGISYVDYFNALLLIVAFGQWAAPAGDLQVREGWGGYRSFSSLPVGSLWVDCISLVKTLTLVRQTSPLLWPGVIMDPNLLPTSYFYVPYIAVLLIAPLLGFL